MTTLEMRLSALSWTHYALVVAALGCLLSLAFFFATDLPQEIEGWYWEHAVGDSLQSELGFRTGEIRSSFGCQGFGWGIVSVRPGGEFDKQGLQEGDVPFRVRLRYSDGTTGEPMIWYHGRNDARRMFYGLLSQTGDGAAAEFAVVPCNSKPDEATRWVSVRTPKD